MARLNWLKQSGTAELFILQTVAASDNFSLSRWVCEDFPELRSALETNILTGYDSKRY